ncbi:TetR/AcrR family transcriptional regulator [Actinomadura sp. WMMA1423]|uniref:TetR/AcrR family transcriptional regulator n=1 Tax=Actinomadura sp. WMMA1423 TaxID=2591108 RepID=UPI00114746C7|nr:TetR/AcrR family transcriptional regulator [Actinomadura sp. WMMA1423]
MTAAPSPAPAGRADALRNRETVLRTAARVFAEEGLEVSLGRIAQRAGVGAGTVYRHFPSKDALVEAVLARNVEGLVAAADRWAARAAPGEALFGFLLEVIEKSAGRRHVCDVLTADRGWPRAVLGAAAQRFGKALERLLRDAKEAGAVRADVRADDLSALVIGCSALLSAHRDSGRGMRMARFMLDGLRPPVVTKADVFRDAPSSPGHETKGLRYCAECGAQLRTRPTGRPARFCGPTCRQRAHRRRPVTWQG